MYFKIKKWRKTDLYVFIDKQITKRIDFFITYSG